MDLNYTKNKPYEFRLRVWRAMEDAQDIYPYLELGWNGFILMIIYRGEPR